MIRRIAAALLLGLAAGASSGCELLATVDRSLIPEGRAGEGGGGAGAGGSAATTTTGSGAGGSGGSATTSSGAGAGGSGGAGGAGGSGTGASGGAGGAGAGAGGSGGAGAGGAGGSGGASAPFCGDGALDPGEICDDGNAQGYDGCSSNCLVIDAFDESELNDNVADADGPFPLGVLLRGSITPASDVDLFALELTETADLRLETFDGSGVGSCANIDTVLTLFAPDGGVLASDDDAGLGACSRLDRVIAPAVGHLPPGTYLLRVEAYASFEPIPAYSLQLSFDALCDDGLKQGLEECDGEPTCGPSCDRIPLCGDGLIDAPEVCDDGGASAGDGCDASCQYELLAESEPNDEVATASGPFSPNVLLGGTIAPASDVDTFALSLPSTGDLALRVFDGSGPGSCVGLDTVLKLLAPDGSTVLVEADQGGLAGCSAIDPAKPLGKKARKLAPGTYFARVEDVGHDSPIAAYTLLVTYAARCGDGAVEGSEECDGGALCSASCERIPVCGDGFVDAPETCDDGGQLGGDGCSSTCLLELSFESEPNDAAMSASGPFVPFVLIEGAIEPADDSDFYAVVLSATSDLSIESFDGEGPGSCVGVDTVVTLRGTNGLSTLVYKDEGGIEHCSRVDPAVDPGARHLAPGTYFVEVHDFQNNTLIPAYRLSIAIQARCGDGKVEGFEECDGGPLCTAGCDRVPVCGDGLIDLPESCDDGNAQGGDGCSATCQMEIVAEAEPNDTTAAADAWALSPMPVKLTKSGFIAGAISPIGDRDVVRIELAQATTLRLETFDPSGSGCVIATTLRLLDAGGAELFADDNSGLSTCSALVLNLGAGVYYASVAERDDDAIIGNYRLALTVASEAGSEIEPNESAGHATAFAGNEAVIAGQHPSITDTDFYALVVPSGASLRAEIIEGGGEPCEGFDVDSALTLYDASGVALGSDDDGGRGYCSRFDGFGALPESPFAHLLPAGEYFLAVEASPIAQAAGDASAIFDYRLVISLR